MPSLFFEQEQNLRGFTRVAGIDEAGRGPLAGPVSVAAVILPDGFTHHLLDDSKKLGTRSRELLFDELTSREDITWSVCLGEVEEIDAVNILNATHSAMARAALALDPKPDYCLIDGLQVPGFPVPSEGLVKGDGKSFSIAAASIIAKVARDRIMVEYAEKYPEYGFDRHKGYGTRQHLKALRDHGPCPIHRKSFAPVAQLNLPFD